LRPSERVVRDQLGKVPFAGGFQLSPALAQLGLDVGVAESLVDPLLGLAELRLTALDLGDAVLGDGQPTGHRVLAEADVVRLGAGEVLEQVAERLRGDDPQVDPDAVVRLRPQAVRPRLPGGRDQRVLRQVLGERCGLGRGRDQVDVLAGLGPAPDRAGHLDPLSRRMLAQVRRQRLGHRSGFREQDPGAGLACLAELLELGEDVFLDLRAEPFEPPDPLLLRRLPEVLDRGHTELVVEASRRFRPQARDPRHLDQGGRELLLQLRRGRDLAGLQERVDLLRQGLAHPGDLGRPAGRRQIGDRDRALADRLGRGAVGEHPVFDRAVELVEHSELIERGGDLCVGHTGELKACL
jgi:hypothetical protein